MRLHDLLLPIALLAIATSLPATATAQARGNQTYRPSNQQATRDMRSRMAAAIERVRVTQQHGAISPARSAALREQIALARRQMAGFERQQGFVSAAELASYDRLLVAIDAALGVGATKRRHGSDALPSAEVLAFKQTDKRLNDRYARIEYDAKGCALYRGTTRAGRERREMLHDLRGRPICPRR